MKRILVANKGNVINGNQIKEMKQIVLNNDKNDDFSLKEKFQNQIEKLSDVELKLIKFFNQNTVLVYSGMSIEPKNQLITESHLDILELIAEADEVNYYIEYGSYLVIEVIKDGIIEEYHCKALTSKGQKIYYKIKSLFTKEKVFEQLNSNWDYSFFPNFDLYFNS